MRKLLGGIALLLGVVLTSMIVYPDANPSSLFVKQATVVPTVTVTELPKGTFVKKENSTIEIPSGTVSASPTSKLHGIVTPLAKLTFQSNKTTPSTNALQDTMAPHLHWEIYDRGSFSSSFTGASAASDVYSKYLFSISRSNQLKVDMQVTGENSSTTQYAVYLYDNMVSDGLVYSNVLPVGQSVSVTYPNLNPTHVYYLRWSPVTKDQPIDGKYIVHY